MLEGIEKVNRKLDSEIKMREIVNEANQRTKKISEDIDRGHDKMNKMIADLFQLSKVHEDKMARFQDDKATFEKSRDRLRQDVREFEKLCQDISKFGSE